MQLPACGSYWTFCAYAHLKAWRRIGAWYETLRKHHKWAWRVGRQDLKQERLFKRGWIKTRQAARQKQYEDPPPMGLVWSLCASDSLISDPGLICRMGVFRLHSALAQYTDQWQNLDVCMSKDERTLRMFEKRTRGQQGGNVGQREATCRPCLRL
jgi:hypothetical protein